MLVSIEHLTSNVCLLIIQPETEEKNSEIDFFQLTFYFSDFRWLAILQNKIKKIKFTRRVVLFLFWFTIVNEWHFCCLFLYVNVSNRWLLLIIWLINSNFNETDGEFMKSMLTWVKLYLGLWYAALSSDHFDYHYQKFLWLFKIAVNVLAFILSSNDSFVSFIWLVSNWIYSKQ